MFSRWYGVSRSPGKRGLTVEHDAVALSYGASAVNRGEMCLLHDKRTLTPVSATTREGVINMTIRHTLQATVLAASIAFGSAALPAAVSAAPSAAPSAITAAGTAASSAGIGADGLAGYAKAAVDVWVQYTQTGSAEDLAQFGSIRDSVAAAAANRLGLDAADMQAAWRDADAAHQVAVLSSLTQLGTRYRFAARSPGVAFDCSGLSSWSWAQAGVTLARQSRSQISNATPVSRENAQPGDFVYYPGHLMMYLGVDNAIIHAPFTGRNIELGFVSKNRAKSARFGDPTG